eukprot:Nk52_evm7s503 gene=Nk52_evmTU7s503
MLDCATDALVNREVEVKRLEDCGRTDIFRTPVWKWAARTLIPRDPPTGTQEDRLRNARLILNVRKWHRIWELADLDTIGDWYNEDPGEERFFTVEEMSNYIAREGRTQLSHEMKQLTERVISCMVEELSAILRNKSRERISVGDWVQLDAADGECYRYRVMRKKRGMVYATYAEHRDPQLKGSRHDNLILTCFASEVYPEDSLTILDSCALPTINGKQRACVEGVREIMTLRMEDHINPEQKRTPKTRERWNLMLREWDSNNDIMERIFIRLYSLTKGHCKGLYFQYMWLFLHWKLWTKDRQKDKLGDTFDDAGKGTICPLCGTEEETMSHINVCEGYLRVMDGQEGDAGANIFRRLLHRPKWVIVCFAIAWKERNAFFYGDQDAPTTIEAIMEKVRWEWDARPRAKKREAKSGGIY